MLRQLRGDMATMSDEDLRKLVGKLNILQLKELLGKVGVPSTAINT